MPGQGSLVGRVFGRLRAAVRAWRRPLDSELRVLQEEVREMRREMHARMLQYNHQLGRMARLADSDLSHRSLAKADESGERRLSGRAIPVEAGEHEPASWDAIGDEEPFPDPEGREWLTLDACPVCGSPERTLVNPWNKFILIQKAPDQTSARYDYSVCHACGVLYATRRPVGGRYRFLLAHFGEVVAKRGSRGTGEITNRLLNPYPLSDADRDELRRLAAHGVFVSDHLGLTGKQYLAPLLRDRFENCVHTDIIGSLVEPRGARVVEVRSRAGTILDGLRRAWGATVFAMPIWESQQFLLRELFGIATSPLIDFERFQIPFDGEFDLIICNHMFTHALHPRDFFAELRRKLKPGGHIYLYHDPDDAEFLAGNQSMFATLNPLHMQAFDQASLVRALAANGFETVFVKGRSLQHLALARLLPTPPVMKPMSSRQRDARIETYRQAFDRAVLGVDEALRPRVAAEWPAAVERAVAAGVADYDERGRLRLVSR
jgi:SAM-dependent methyltransferase